MGKQTSNNILKKKPTVNDLYELCDSLRLYLLVVSDNVDYQLKFMDVVSGKESVFFFMEGSFANMKKFITWWFEDYQKIIDSIKPKKADLYKIS